MKKIRSLFSFGFVLLILTGCEQVLYDSMHGNWKIQCHTIPDVQERRECESRHGVPYNEHQRSQQYR